MRCRNIFLLFLSLAFFSSGLFAMDPPPRTQRPGGYVGSYEEIWKTLYGYAQYPARDDKIVFTGAVLPDGWGDLGNLFNTVKIFKDAHPTWPIRVIIGVCCRRDTYNCSDRVSDIPLNFRDFGLNEEEVLILSYKWIRTFNADKAEWFMPFSAEAIYFEKILRVEPSEDNIDAKVRAKLHNFAEYLNDTELIISISTFFTFKTLKRPNIPHLFLSEFGTPYPLLIPPDLRGQINEPNIDNTVWKMGLGSDCLGIPILPARTTDSFDSIILQKYFTSDGFNFFNYKAPINIFVSCILSLYPGEDIITIASTAIEGSGDASFKAHFALSEYENAETKVVLISKSGDEKVLHDPGEYKRKLIFLDVFPLTNADFNRALSLAKPPVGVTGNASFSQELSKLPYYHPSNPPTSEFLEQIAGLAETELEYPVALISFIKIMQKYKQRSQFEEFPNELKFIKTTLRPSPESLPQMEKVWFRLVEKVEKYWDLKPKLLGLINMRLSRLKDPNSNRRLTNAYATVPHIVPQIPRPALPPRHATWQDFCKKHKISHNYQRYCLAMSGLSDLLPGFQQQAAGDTEVKASKRIKRIKDIEYCFTKILITVDMGVFEDNNTIALELQNLFSKRNPENNIFVPDSPIEDFFALFGFENESEAKLLDELFVLTKK